MRCGRRGRAQSGGVAAARGKTSRRRGGKGREEGLGRGGGEGPGGGGATTMDLLRSPLSSEAFPSSNRTLPLRSEPCRRHGAYRDKGGLPEGTAAGQGESQGQGFRVHGGGGHVQSPGVAAATGKARTGSDCFGEIRFAPGYRLSGGCAAEVSRARAELSATGRESGQGESTREEDGSEERFEGESAEGGAEA